VLFGWFGASGLGPNWVAEPASSGVCQARRNRGQLVVQRFNSGDGKLGAPFVGPSAASWVLIC